MLDDVSMKHFSDRLRREGIPIALGMMGGMGGGMMGGGMMGGGMRPPMY